MEEDNGHNHHVTKLIYHSDVNLNKSENKVIKVNAITEKCQSSFVCLSEENLETEFGHNIKAKLFSFFSLWGYKKERD